MRAALAAWLLLGAACAAPAARPETADAPAAAEPATFAGVWSTTYGAMRLTVEGEHARGTYSFGDGATIEGQIAGREMRAEYVESDGTRGRALFALAPDGASFRGVWKAGLDGPALALDDRSLQRWRGTRVAPVEGRVWLVILESHWEASLAEHEYSYGDMLRAFFERLPNVEVRHRFVNSRADLVRFVEETGMLAEPCVLYVSSHGSPSGIQVGVDVVDGRTFGEALRERGQLRLLHFGACSVLGGDFAEQLRLAMGPGGSFPISGYLRDADWAGSAIVDFAYLDLVLELELDPAEAVAETRRTIQFAGDGRGKGKGIEPIDLVIR